MGAEIVTKELKKSYLKQVALDGLSLTIPKDSVTALVGSNGAGKTTTFSLIGGFFKPDQGHIEIDGQPLRVFRREGGIIGLLPQDVLFFESRTIERQLFLFARLSGLAAPQAHLEVERVLKLVQLTERGKEIAANLSHGMKVRLGIAQALIGDPVAILLDEPTAGLDPRMLSIFRSIIDGLRGRTTIVISSHDLSQLELMCDYVCMLDRGRLIRQGPLQDLLSKVRRITFKIDRAIDPMALDQVSAHIECEMRDEGVLLVDFDPLKTNVTEVNTKVLQWLLERSVGVIQVDSQRSLEQTFLEETGQ